MRDQPSAELVHHIMFSNTRRTQVANLAESVEMDFTELRLRATSNAMHVTAAKTIPVEDEETGATIKVELADFMKRFHMHESPGDQGTPSKAWGTIRFQAKQASAPYLRLSANDDPNDALLFVKGMLAQKYGENYDRPSLLLSVTGGARNFTLPQRLENAISKGLRQAAQRTNAWVITGGTNTGVMRLTGEIMEKLSKTQTGFVPPTIGIATYGVIVGGEDLTAKDGKLPVLDAKHDINKKDPPKAPLNPDHNLFLLVDDGSNKKFGREILFRAAFERAARDAFEAPVVTIVVQGGPGTLNTALEAVKQGTPIVVVDGSGLAADVLAYAYNFLHNPLSRYTSYTTEDLKQMVARAFKNQPPEKLNEFLHSALECVQDPNLVVVYSLQDSGIDEFDDCILEAVFSSQGSLSNKLKQAMYFDQLEAARQLLANASESSEDLNKCITENLMAALTHNKPHFVELYLNHGAKIHKLAPHGEFPATGIASLDGLPPFALAIEELYSREAKKPHSYLQALVAKSKADTAEALFRPSRAKSLVAGARRGQTSPLSRYESRSVAATRGYNVLRMDRVLSRLVSSDLNVERDFSIYTDNNSNSGDGGRKRESAEALERQREEQALHILFLWAVCTDRYSMAYMFWLRGNQSIVNALVASRILSRLSTHPALSGPHLVEERQKMKEDATNFEQLAVGVLAECHAADAHLTAQMLHSHNEMFSKKNAINVAYDADSLAFLSHPATQSVINADWYGQLKAVTSFWMVLFALFLPMFVLPFISFQDDDAEEEEIEGPRDFFVQDTVERMQAEVQSTFKRVRRKFAKFYAAPYTRFVSDLLSHLALCVLSSYFVLNRLGDEISGTEIVLVVWFIALLLEELRQMVWRDGVWEYLSDTWNRLDLTMISLFAAGFVIRVINPSSPDTRHASKAVHAFLVVVLWMRFMRYYAISQNLGPKLIMMIEMIKDVVTFVCLLLIFLIGYGVAAQSLLYPEEEFSSQTFINVLYRPYFQIYGELFLDDINDESGCIGSFPFSNCGRESVRMVPFFLAVYVLGANILLVNLLIAMFNDTYIKVQEKAADLWRKQNYELFEEYKDRPFLPAPLILLTHAYMLLQWLLKCCGVKPRPPKSNNAPDMQHQISTFEDLNTEKFLLRFHREKRETQEERVKATSENVEHAVALMGQMLEYMVSFRATLDRQMTTLKHEMHHGDGIGGDDSVTSVSMVRRRNLSDAVAYGAGGAGTAAGPIHRFNSSAAVHGEAADADKHYVPPLEYPRSGGVKRQALDPSMVPWTNDCPNYNPTEYTHPAVASQPVWADPADPRSIKFNTKDEVEGKVVDRTTCHPLGIIRIDEGTGRPINPFGRTGMTGRGLLGKWGVNQAADTVVTRWRRAKDGSILERDGKKVLEFIAIQRNDNNAWAIPGGFVDNGEDLAVANGREFMEEALNVKGDKGKSQLSNEEKESLSTLFSNGEAVARIYSEDPRNTDNAWVETTCVNFHDDTGRYASKLKLQGGDDAKHARWMMVHGEVDLFASHKKLLRLVAEVHGAFV